MQLTNLEAKLVKNIDRQRRHQKMFAWSLIASFPLIYVADDPEASRQLATGSQATEPSPLQPS